MSAISFLRITRRFRSSDSQTEYPNLETLIEQEGDKIKDGYHYARWITPLAGNLVAFGCFLPLAILASPWFWIGTAVFSGVTLILGVVFHILAKRITPIQLKLRQKCMKLGLRMISLRSLLGSVPPISPQVAELLEEAARTYLSVVPSTPQENSYFEESARKAQVGLEAAMLQLLSLADAETPAAQEKELDRGWAQPLLAEMQATVARLENSRRTLSGTMGNHISSGPIAALREVQSDLDRLETAVTELNQEVRE